MNYQELGRQYRAALKEKAPNRFINDITDALKAKQLRPNDFSIRRLFESLVDDGMQIVESWNPRNGGQGGVSLAEVDAHSPAHLLEAGAVMSTAFGNITGQIVYNKVMEAYTDEAFVFTPLVTTVSTQFNGEKIAGITRLGDNFESIPEASPYPLAGIGEDWIETPQTTKRGEIVPLTKEAIFFDRTGLILQRAGEVGTFYGMNKEKRIIDAVIDENVTGHRYKWKGIIYATFQSTTPWVNLKTSNALVNWVDIDDAELVFSELIDPHTGEPILINPKHLVCTRVLRNTARQIVNAVEVRKGDGASNTAVTIGASPLETNYEIKSSALLAQRMGTDTTWYIGDVGKAVNYMENWPMAVVEAPANSEMEFTHDIVRRWKVSERGTTVVVEPRALVKNTVA